MNSQWLIDKSAWVRLLGSPDAELWLDRINRGVVLIATATLLEQGYSARSFTDWQLVTSGDLVSLLPQVFMTPRSETRAVEVQGMLAKRGYHRAPSVSDLLIAAIAEEYGLTVLHVDKDFELIAEITGQPTERLRTE